MMRFYSPFFWEYLLRKRLKKTGCHMEAECICLYGQIPEVVVWGMEGR